MNAHEAHESDPIVKSIVGAAYEVQNTLGAGFLEKVYERALTRELADRGIKAKAQVRVPVFYKNQNVGEYIADLLVEDRVIVELKCSECLAPEHLAQCLNYLKAARKKTGVLINFQHSKVEWRVLFNG